MTRYACTNYGCPTRAPVTATSPPTCYTCARPMTAAREVVAAGRGVAAPSAFVPIEINERTVGVAPPVRHLDATAGAVFCGAILPRGGHALAKSFDETTCYACLYSAVDRCSGSTSDVSAAMLAGARKRIAALGVVGSWSTTTGRLTASGGIGGGGGSGAAVAVAFTRKPTDEERATRTLPPMVARMPALSEHIILIRANGVESAITIDHKPTIVDYGTGYGRSLSFDSRASLDTVALLNGLYHKRTPFAVECGALFKSSCVLIGSYTVRTAASGLVIVEIEFRAIGDAP